MKNLLIITATLVLLFAGNAMAIDWEWAGAVFDQQIFDYNNDWSPISYPDLPPNTPSPGGDDAELFDFEGAKFGMDNDYLYFAVTSSFGWGAEWNDYFYETGDFFFGFDGDCTMFGVDYDDGGIYYNDETPFGIPNVPGGYYNNPSIVSQAGPFDINTNSTLLGGADGTTHLAMEFEEDDTYVIEIRLEKSIFTDFGVDFNDISTVCISQTVACGNDVIQNEFPAIPEPGTMALMGLGLLGAGIIRRRKKK